MLASERIVDQLFHLCPSHLFESLLRLQMRRIDVEGDLSLLALQLRFHKSLSLVLTG